MEMRMDIKNTSVTRTESITLIKNLFRAAFSSIAYLRNFFHEDYFKVCKIGKIGYYRICNTTNADVRTFVDWLERGVFDALKRKYLDVVVLEVYKTQQRNKSTIGFPSAEMELLECFSFKVTYSEGNAQLSLSGRDATSAPTETRRQHGRDIAGVLRSLISLTHTLRPLPKNHSVGIKLYYTPETTAEYEPPMFRPVSEESESWFVEKPLRVSAGTFSTPFHQMRMTVRAQANAENMAAGVFDTGSDASDGEDMIVDVGSMQNSGRVGTIVGKQNQKEEEAQEMGQKNETQKAPHSDTQGSGVCRLRIRAPESSTRCGKRKIGLEADTLTTSVLKKKKRKVSREQKRIRITVRP